MRAKGELLLVDGGDYVHPTATHEERENQLILRSMGSMRYDAMCLGELELNRGVGYVQSILDSARVPIALANVRFAKSKKPVGERFIIRDVGGVKCGIIGLLGQDFGDGKGKFAELGFDVEDPFEVADKLVPEVRKKGVDLIIVLAHLGAADALQLPKAIKGIDVVVFGHYPGTVAPTQVAEALTIRSGQRGQYVGETRIVLNPEDKIVSYGGEAVALDVKVVKENPGIAAERAALKELIGPAGGDEGKKSKGGAHSALPGNKTKTAASDMSGIQVIE